LDKSTQLTLKPSKLRDEFGAWASEQAWGEACNEAKCVGIPSEIVLSSEDGMAQECAVNFDPLQTVPKAKLGRLIAVLSIEQMSAAAPAICFALGIDDLLI
jgi:hypothetical protein